MKRNTGALIVIVWLACTCALLSDPQEMPQPKKRVDPAYPTILKKACIEADVDVKVLVNEKGLVDRAEAVNVTNPSFTQAAIDAAAKWEFIPAMKDGKPIKAEVTIPFKFRLMDKRQASRIAELETLTDKVKRYLQGDTDTGLAAFADPSAYIVLGTEYEHLHAVLRDKAKQKRMMQGAEQNYYNMHLGVDNDESSAYLVLLSLSKSGRTNRYHTIVMMKNEKNVWTIKAWHTSP